MFYGKDNAYFNLNTNLKYMFELSTYSQVKIKAR